MKQLNTPLTTVNFNLDHESSDEIDLRRYILLFLRKWYWLALGALLGGLIAFVYLRHAPVKFRVDTSLLVKDPEGMSMENMLLRNLPVSSGQNVDEDEAALLNSYALNYKAVDNLNWQAIWHKRDFIFWNDIYSEEPFQLTKSDDAPNPAGINVYITPLSKHEFLAEADGTVEIGKEEIKINFSQTGRFGKEFRNEYFAFTLVAPDTSRFEIDDNYRFSFIDKPALTRYYLERLESFLSNDSKVISLVIKSTTPLRDIHYLNELVRVYLDMKLETQTQAQKRSIDFINEQLSGIAANLDSAETSFTSFRSQNQVIDLSSQGSLIMEQLKEIESEKSQLQMQLDYYRSLYQYLQNNHDGDKLVAPSVAGITDMALNSLVMKLADLYSRRKLLSFSARSNNPTLTMLNEQITQITDQLREMLANLIQNTEQGVKTLTARFDHINGRLNNMPEKEQKFINIKRQYELTNDIYMFLLHRRAELQLTLAATVVNISVIDQALPERLVKLSPNPYMILLLGLFMGLFLPAGILLINNCLSNKIKLQEDVERMTTIPVIGNVLHSHLKTELIVYNHPTAPITESYRTIRTNLEFKLPGNGPHVISLHSLIPGEGKTFSSSNIASILAMNNHPTVIIGADMRKPRLQQIFEGVAEPGLSNYLAGHAETHEIIKPSGIDNLDVIFSGPVPPNPAELLAGERMATLMQELKKHYRYVIIDNAPVSLVTDGLLTGKLSDLNLFVLRYCVSKKDQIKFINELVAKGAIENPALLINDIKIDDLGYGYSYKYAYGKGYRS